MLVRMLRAAELPNVRIISLATTKTTENVYNSVRQNKKKNIIIFAFASGRSVGRPGLSVVHIYTCIYTSACMCI